MTSGNLEVIPGWGQAINGSQLLPGNNWYAGWMDVQFYSQPYNSNFNQAWVGVQHSGPGAVLSVGHSAMNLNGEFNCNPPIHYAPGVEP